LKNYELDLDWRGFELHPETPPGGVPVSTFFPADQLAETQAYLTGFAAKFDIHDMQVSGHVPNTRRALAATELAREQGRLHAFREAAMFGFWQRGVDVEGDEGLRLLALESGLDPDGVVAAADDPVYLGRVDALRAEAKGRGVNAIPAFFFGDQRAPLVGCQSYALLASSAEAAGAVRRR
jgi:predicted DsbA family dithiol-disulfide isomerase